MQTLASKQSKHGDISTCERSRGNQIAETDKLDDEEKL